MSDNVEFIGYRLFPKRHTDKPRLDEGEVVRVKKELPKASARNWHRATTLAWRRF